MRITKMHPKKKETHIVKKKQRTQKLSWQAKAFKELFGGGLLCWNLPRNRAVTCDLVYH